MSSADAINLGLLEGLTALVTGANSGIGFHTARHLARNGASVFLACRNPHTAGAALERIKSELPNAKLQSLTLDLADLDSVASAASHVVGLARPLNLLINNAGVMALRERATTRQGFELQFGTNHLGHFALTLRLLPLLLSQRNSRVVTVSALRHRGGEIAFDDLQSEQRYSPWSAYSQSKLANLLFAQELHRLVQARSLALLSVAAHPGLATTNLFLNGPALNASPITRAILTAINRLVGQSADSGAWPSLYAATSNSVVSGGYYGPSGFLELRGLPGAAKLSDKARDADRARRLWVMSEQLTGLKFDSAVG